MIKTEFDSVTSGTIQSGASDRLFIPRAQAVKIMARSKGKSLLSTGRHEYSMRPIIANSKEMTVNRAGN